MSSPVFLTPSSHTPETTATRRRRNTKALAAMLLAAVMSAMIVAADSLVDIYAEGHLLIGWISLWLVGFAAWALFASTARRAATRVAHFFRTRRQRRAQKRSDAYLMALAEHDPKIMSELQAAIERAEASAQSMERALAQAWIERQPVGTFNAAYQGRRNSFKTTPLAGLPTHLQYL